MSHSLSLFPFIFWKRLWRRVGIEFLKFRATCKSCHLAAPLMRMRDEAALMKLRSYSFASPLLMVVDENRGGIMNLTDPVFGDKYIMNTSHDQEEIIICCSRYGWLLLFYTNSRYLVFFNPFTRNVHKLPSTSLWLENLCFSAPPTSPDCMVVGFTTQDDGQDDDVRHMYILHFVSTTTQEPLWRIVDLDYGPDAPYAFRFPTFHGPHLYALCNEGRLVVFKEISQVQVRSSWEEVVAEAPKSQFQWMTWARRNTQYYLVKRDQHLLLVILGIYGEYLEVFQLDDSTKEWEKIDSLGRHAIYISDTTCCCIEARIPKLQNKIYFPNLHTENGKIVFYSLDKSDYYAFDGDKIEATACKTMFLGTKYHLNPYAWIEPSWC
ncbi:F-box/kelch-repeat protein At1g57790-like [Rutidosis leptorrhynchoides]|uniref:F-box/kelch-repeat protein At1g57790-like n=1 Tax=Rutidosis leptorrhynchoides TaxID=125765 RepID=UPI003A9A667E